MTKKTKKVMPVNAIVDDLIEDIGDPNFNTRLTVAEVRDAVPTRFSKMIDREFVDHLNNIANDPMEASYIKENFITFGGILNEGRYSISDYTNAVKYISYLMLNHTKASAYSKTFPERYKRLKDAGRDQRYISAYVSAYDSGKLVTELRKQTLVPVYIHNRPLLQRAINVQAQIMLDEDNSAFVRSTAAKHLMDALKEPQEATQLNIGIVNNIGEDSAIKALADSLNKLTDAQEQSILEGVYTTKEVAEMALFDNNIIEENEDE